MNEILLILISLVVCIFFILIYKESFIISYIIITLLAIPSDLGATLRTIIQISDYALLFYLFFKQYGFDIKNYPVVPKFVVYFSGLLYLSMVLSMVFSKYPSAGFILVFRSTAFFILVYLFYGIIQTKKHVKVVFMSLLVTGLILMSGVIMDFLLSDRRLTYLIQPLRDTSYGIYGNKNTTGVYSIIVFPIILTLLFEVKGKKKFLVWSGILIIILSVMLLASRSALAGIIISTTITLFFLKRRVFKFFSSIILVIILGFFLLPLNSSIDYALRINGGLSNHDDYWELAIRMIKQHPVFGIGVGSYPLEEFNYIPVMLNSYVGESMISIHDLTKGDGSNNSHNMYLVLASDMGIPGFISILILIIPFFRILYLTYKKYKNTADDVRGHLIIIFAAVMCLLLRGFVEPAGIFSYGAISVDLPFWLMLIILVSYYYDRFEILNRKP